MAAFWSAPVDEFLQTGRSTITGMLAEAQIRHHRTNDVQQLRAWEDSIDLLRTALLAQDDALSWHLLLEYPMLRLGRRADAILLTGRAILVLEFKIGATSYDPASLEQAEDYALDLQDFHAGCRRHPIVPILVATHAPPRAATLPLVLPGTVADVLTANAATLPGLIALLAGSCPGPAEPLDPATWLAAPYRPVPTIVEAACMLYGRHGVADIAAARADASNLTRTTAAILAAIATARAAEEKLILFVTGIPGAGKTLCGLNAAFGQPGEARATFLTGNPSLVHVLREALARDAIAGGANRRLARQQMEQAIQALPRFRDHHIATGEIPAERIVVIDEAQRCWSRAQAVAKSRDRPVRLTDSEPALLLQAMGRHAGFAAMICLVGSGQEIHDGEGGLAEWGEALRASPAWRVLAAPDLLTTPDPRQRLGTVPGLQAVAELHLSVPIRQIRSTASAAWVDRVLLGDAAGAASIAGSAGDAMPFQLTRSLPALRAALRVAARGTRRCGLLASAGAKRLRAEGLGSELPHMDAQAVARWFLDRWPDVRASDALETVATEFSCQGLELDFAGLCWDADLIRAPGRTAWLVRAFRGTAWTQPAGAETIANQINSYRVLLTRARYETIIFVPTGDPADATRSPAIYNGIADFLARCGARDLAPCPACRDRPREGRGRQGPAVRSVLALLLCLAGAPANAEALKISTWNLDWLTARSHAEAGLPADAPHRTAEDIARLAAYAQKLAADIVAFQEVDGSQAAALIFDPTHYRIVTIDEDVVQRVGIAVRRDIAITRNPDLTALDVEPQAMFRLRDGLDVTLTLPGGAQLRVLVVHLKTGCQTDSLAISHRPQCALLARQIPPLAAWVAARNREGGAFLLMGDFNRVLDAPEELGDALARAAPLRRATAGYENPCWDGAPFIDHIFAGGPARLWLQADSLRVQLFHEIGTAWKQRLSDHCPVSVRLDPNRN